MAPYRDGLVAYRIWQPVDGRLKSQTRNYFWQRWGNMAVCMLNTQPYRPDLDKTLCPPGLSPNPDCPLEHGCGLWGYLEPEQAVKRAKEWNGPQVVGGVLAWGRILRLSDGAIRAEVMDIWCLASIPYAYSPRIYPAYLDMCEQIATSVRIPYRVTLHSQETAQWLKDTMRYLDTV